MPAVGQGGHVKASILEARAADVVVRAKARLVRVDDDLVVASGAAGEGVPGASARDRGLEEAVDGPGAVRVDTVAEACRVAAAAEEDTILGTSRSFDDARAASGASIVARGAAKDDLTIQHINRHNQVRRAECLRQLSRCVGAVVDPEMVQVAPLLVAALVVADREELCTHRR